MKINTVWTIKGRGVTLQVTDQELPPGLLGCGNPIFFGNSNSAARKGVYSCLFPAISEDNILVRGTIHELDNQVPNPLCFSTRRKAISFLNQSVSLLIAANGGNVDSVSILEESP